MAIRPEYFPGLDKRLLQVVWNSTPLGLLFLHVRAPWFMVPDVMNPGDDYVEPTNSKKPLPGAYRPTITDLPGYDTIELFSNVTLRGAQVTGSTNPPAIVDPVTVEMMAYYAAWTPPNSPPFYTTAEKQFPPSEVWIIDRANWQLVYNHVITARSHFGTRDEAQAYFDSDPTIVDHSKPIGVVIEQIYDVPGGRSPPMPPSQEGWAFWNAAAAQGWAGHLESTPGPKNTGQVTSMNIILNLTQIARSMTAAQKKAKEFKFRINWPDTNGYDFVESVAYTVKNKYDGQPQNYQPRRTFPVKQPQLQPDFVGDGEGTVGGDPFITESGEGASIGSGAYTLVTVKTNPFDVSFSFVGTPIGGSEG